MNILLVPPSDKELDDAITYYNTQNTILGKRFYHAFLESTEHIIATPDLWPKVGSTTFKKQILPFSYFILYMIVDDEIQITCISHQRRSPRYYTGREK